MSALSLRLPEFLHKAVKTLAKREHTSVNQLIMLAIVEKLSALDTVDYMEARIKRADRKKFLAILKSAPKVEPDEEDRL